jgi:hypothetical protein
MRALRWILAAIWIAAFLTGRAVFDFSGAVSDTASQRRVAARTISDTGTTPAPAPRSGGPRIDLYGNPIDRAVTDYRVDPRGALYERHAPDTAVLKLPAPGT